MSPLYRPIAADNPSIYSSHGLRSAQVIEGDEDQTHTHLIKEYKLGCRTMYSDNRYCSQSGELEIHMNRLNGNIGKKLHSTTYLISVQCPGCKQRMDWINPDFNPRTCNDILLNQSGLVSEEFDIMSFKKSRGRGSGYMATKQSEQREPLTVACGATDESYNLIRNRKDDQSRITNLLKYTWKFDNSKHDEPTTIYIHPVNTLNRPCTLRELQDIHNRDLQASMRSPAQPGSSGTSGITR